MNHTRIGLAIVSTTAALLVALPAGAAHASTTYTWTAGLDNPSADHHRWSDPQNWSPAGVPGDGDAVVIPSIERHTSYIDEVPDAISLSSLRVDGGDHDTHLGVGGEDIAVTDSFVWSGGEIVSDLTLPPGATGSVTAGSLKQLSGDLSVSGTLTMSDIGSDGLKMWEGHRIEVSPGGSLLSQGTNGIDYDACCGNPNKVVNRGTIEVLSGSLTLEMMELDQFGTLRAAEGATLHASGVARLGPDSSYDGPGTLLLDHSESPQPDVKHPNAVQGAGLLSGSNTLTGGFHVTAGDGSILTGQATFSGDGTVTLAGATVYADLTVGSATHLTTAGPLVSRVGVWDHELTGYHGRLTVLGTATVAPHTTLQLDARTQTVVGRGGSMTVEGGSTVTSGSCCSSTPTFVTNPGSRLVLGEGSGSTRLTWLTMRTSGTTQVATRASVVLDKTAFVQAAGSTTLSAGSTLITRDTEIDLAGGTLLGVGRVAGLVVNSHGTVDPGTSATPATLRVGSYRQTKRGALAVDVAGSRADRLVVAGRAQLGGTLRVVGSGQRGRTMTVLSAGHPSGSFRHTAPHWRVTYSPKQVGIRPA